MTRLVAYDRIGQRVNPRFEIEKAESTVREIAGNLGLPEDAIEIAGILGSLVASRAVASASLANKVESPRTWQLFSWPGSSHLPGDDRSATVFMLASTAGGGPVTHSSAFIDNVGSKFNIIVPTPQGTQPLMPFGLYHYLTLLEPNENNDSLVIASEYSKIPEVRPTQINNLCQLLRNALPGFREQGAQQLLDISLSPSFVRTRSRQNYC